MSDKDDDRMTVDAALVRQLAELLNDTQLTEIEVEDHGRRIKVARQQSVQHALMPSTSPTIVAPSMQPQAGAETPSPPAGNHPGTVKSPMVGTAYLSPEPGAAPFISVGKSVAAGETLLIVEAMKVMNPIAAPRAGVVKSLLVDDGQAIEFDQPLVVVE